MVQRLVDDELDGGVRPWDLPELRSRGRELGEVSGARVISVDEHNVVAELAPGGERLVFRGVEDRWRLVRFADGDDVALHPETTRTVDLDGSGPDAVLAAMGVAKPDGLQMKWSSEDLGQGETQSRHGYYWTDERGRTILAEEIKNEIFDGATPYSTYLRGVIVDGPRGMLLTERNGNAQITEG
jgi:hypothetical protein